MDQIGNLSFAMITTLQEKIKTEKKTPFSYKTYDPGEEYRRYYECHDKVCVIGNRT